MTNFLYVATAMEDSRIKQEWNRRMDEIVRAAFTPEQVRVLQQNVLFRMPTKEEIDDIKEAIGS